MTMLANPYRGFRHSAEVIQYTVWMYCWRSQSLPAVVAENLSRLRAKVIVESAVNI